MLEAVIGGEVDILHDVGCGDSRPISPIEAPLDPSMQRLGVLDQQPCQRRAIPHASQIFTQIMW